jgi:hypothetical protein
MLSVVITANAWLSALIAEMNAMKATLASMNAFLLSSGVITLVGLMRQK